ncbi:YchJ family protein [Carboxylicivirga marina]|uniref:YchJ family protein n=1 Tax=Carboxylicivirga marina TaxID=2800988 RepID=A0ABS1HFI9_9BACT|nr:YchJ family protein [Carboxylicivirga marina]MBK3516445.1 YchJ family protein [Carboxylicivirga marina]
MNCPCASNQLYSQCCQPYINSKENAPTAEKLMRSRYTAFTLANVDYLMKTHHQNTRAINDKAEMKQWASSVQWMGLTVMNTSAGLATDTMGKVEFKALYIEQGVLQAIHEKSLFRKEKGKWYYVSGEHI